MKNYLPICIIVLLSIMCLYIYGKEDKKEEFKTNSIKEKEVNNHFTIASYINGIFSEEMPNDGNYYTNVECLNSSRIAINIESTVKWENNKWNVNISGLNMDSKCNIYFYEVPTEYSILEYIESTGTQYIDTLYKPNMYTGIETEFQFTSLSTQQRLYAVSSDIEFNNLSYDFYINSAGYFSYAYSNGAGNWISTNIFADTNKHKLQFNKDIKNIMIDSTSNYYKTIQGSISNVAERNLMLMARNYKDYDGIRVDKISNIKLYYFSIYENNIMLRYFIPVKRVNDNEIGLYDVVNNKFYINQGTGIFIAGPKTF